LTFTNNQAAELRGWARVRNWIANRTDALAMAAAAGWVPNNVFSRSAQHSSAVSYIITKMNTNPTGVLVVDAEILIYIKAGALMMRRQCL